MLHRTLLLILCALTMMACATLDHGPLQSIEVESDPSGASMQLSGCGGSNKGRTTPATLWVSRRATRCQISLSKPGYDEAVIRLERKYAQPIPYEFDSQADSPAFFVAELAIFAAVVGTSELIDFASGAKYMQVPSFVQVQLTPLEIEDEHWREQELGPE